MVFWRKSKNPRNTAKGIVAGDSNKTQNDKTMRFENKVAVITGDGSGIGAEAEK